MRTRPEPMSLGALAEGLPGAEIVGRQDLLVSGVAGHSRKVQRGDLFVCRPGSLDDGHRYAREAVAQGAVAVVVERFLEGLEGVPQVRLGDSRRSLSTLAARFHGHPSSRLKIVGITGTEGKTTTAFLLDSIIRAAGRSTGLFGTIVNRVGAAERPAELTTPEASDLQRLLWECAEGGVTDVVMEVSSHALSQERVADCEFDVAVLTNLHSDHLDHHGSHDAYRLAKRSLFAALGRGPAKRGWGIGIVNADDAHAKSFREATACPVRTFGVQAEANVVGRLLLGRLGRTTLSVRTRRWAAQVSLRLTGSFNVANALAAISVAECVEIAPGDILAGLERLRVVPGRFEVVSIGRGPVVVIDFAHTLAAFGEVLPALRLLVPGRVITVFGCAGARDHSKRPLIGQLVTRLSDLAIVTTDNPAHEDPAAIAEEIVSGARRVDPRGERHRVVLDRFTAVETALALTRDGDAVLLAGKGHEECQIIDTRRVPYSDHWAVREVLARRGATVEGSADSSRGDW